MFVGFKSLKSLSLKAVDVGYEGIELLLSNCRLLERLFLHQNYGLRHLKVHSPSPMLRYLEVVGGVLKPRMKISVSTDISVLRFYGYIGDISINIFT